MQDCVLTLGEKIILASRLAAIEHVRQELEAAQADSQRAARREALTGGARSDVQSAEGFTDESDAETLTRPVNVILKDVFQRIEANTVAVPRAKTIHKTVANPKAAADGEIAPETAGRISSGKRRRGAA
ncbi:MAG: hypothetical protein JWM57_3264 [Phycisphaerales bacterium]|nr:hypothetical protein [Phycisphaerales bacterium]